MSYSLTITVFLIVFSSFGWVADSGTTFAKWCVFSLIAIFFIFDLIFKRNTSNYKIPINKYSLTFAVLMGLIVLVHGRNYDYVILIKLAMATIISLKINFNLMVLHLNRILPLIFYGSIGGWFFAQFNMGIPIPQTFAFDNLRLYSITLFGTVYIANNPLRAMSYFWEPGVLAVYGNLMLLINLYFNKKLLKNCYMEIVLILISQSLGGVLILIYLLINKGFEKINFNIKLSNILLFILIALMIPLYETYSELIALTLNSILTFITSRDMLYDESYIARSIDFFVPFYAALENSIFGNSDLNAYSDHSVDIVGYSQSIITNSFGLIVYFYGYPLFFLYIFAIIKFSRINFKEKWYVSFGVILLCMIIEPIQFSLLMIIIIFFCIEKRKLM